MKLKFVEQQFQTDAVNAVCDLFAGQEKNQTTFSLEQENPSLFNEFGIGNAFLLDDATLLSNMHAIQKRNNLSLTDDIESRNFCVEMETGTGKSYCEIKTIFELNRRYGFTKFIIVVPSVAIREGIYKSFEITKEHFGAQYDNVPCRFFIYNSTKLSDVRQFATSANIEIMIINIDAFKKSENIINQSQDKLNGETAMRYIRDTNPIVLIDEPQSVDNTPKAKEAIASLNPLCVLRYSATHREKINLLYCLTPVDAYQMGLVKQICVSSNTVDSDFNKPYIRLLSVSMENGFSAKIELDIIGKGRKVERVTKTVKNNSDLFLLSKERELYDGYVVDNIDCTPGKEKIEFTNLEVVPLGKAIGSIDESLVKRAQIKRTIETHLNKELLYYDKGIKVLSLFFIDEVKKYRTSDGGKGIYAQMFEECYAELIALDKYEVLRGRFSSVIEKVHDGYFSQDKKGTYKDTRGDTLADDSTYNTIMRDKEWLLSFECPLRFIWSHSALREGWDNPNIFQICTLIEQKSTFTTRQKIGRGLRLCVNQDGERIEDKDINQLHIMANESFAEFAETLQKEIEAETGMKFGYIQIDMLSGIAYTETVTEVKTVTQSEAETIVRHLERKGYIDSDGKPTEEAKRTVTSDTMELPAEIAAMKDEIVKVIAKAETVTPKVLSGATYTQTVQQEKSVTYEDAQELISHFEKKGYVTKTGKIKDTMKNDILNGTLDLPKRFEAARERFENIVSKADRKPPIRDASKDVIVRLKKQVILSPEFLAIWERIRQKTTYRVQIDSKNLIRRCAKELREMPSIPKARILSQTADIQIQNMGVFHTERETRTMDVQADYNFLPDILTIIAEEAFVSWTDAASIIRESGRINDFIANPRLFIENCVDIIKNNRHSLAIDGISYTKREGERYFWQQIFNSEELMANLDKNAVEVKNSVYDYIIYDSDSVERPFAVALDNDPDVKMFFKIPANFKIETPIGTYNPDFAVYMDKDGEQKMYFVLETKGSLNPLDRRGTENLKIHCGKQHFKALGNDVELREATDWKGIKTKI